MASIVVEDIRSGSGVRRLGLKPVQWLMLGIIGLALAFGGWSMRDSLARTVTIEEVKGSRGTVQVFGYLYSKGAYDDQLNWTFDIQDSSGASIKVVHPTKPGNFDDAISVSATGRFNAEKNVFEADQLLVKCPSKYQEQQQG